MNMKIAKVLNKVICIAKIITNVNNVTKSVCATDHYLHLNS